MIVPADASGDESPLGDYGGPIVQDTRFEATWAKVRYGASTPEWMSYRRQVVQDARCSRPSHSRSEVLSLTRSDHGAVRQRHESRFDGKIAVPGTSPPAPMCCIAADQPHDRCTRPVKADITGSTLRVILRLDSLYFRVQRGGAHAMPSLSPLVLAFLLRCRA